MALTVQQSSALSPPGYPTIALAYFCVAVIFLIPENATRNTASVLCALVTLTAVYNKVKLRPSSVFLLAVAGVILNTYAVGYGLPFKYAVIVSPVLAMTQAFLTLPFKVESVK